MGNFKQRRAIVDTLGWQPFTDWFFQNEFRSWWQLNGCLGVPLYKLYKRNTEWRTGEVILNNDDPDSNGCGDSNGVEGRLNDSSLEERASVLQAKYNSNYNTTNSKPKANVLQKDDSTDDLIASIKANARKRVEAEAAKAAAAAANGGSDNDSGRSTPEHLKKFESCSVTESKRLRTFSETLKMLDDDIVSDLNVK